MCVLDFTFLFIKFITAKRSQANSHHSFTTGFTILLLEQVEVRSDMLLVQHIVVRIYVSKMTTALTDREDQVLIYKTLVIGDGIGWADRVIFGVDQ